jgi:putative transposase
MGAPLSNDLRIRVVEAVECQGMSRRAAAARFGIGIRTAVRWVSDYRTSGSVAPRKMGNPSAPKLTAHRETVLAILERQPDITIEALRHELADRGIGIGYGSIRRFFQRERITRKKRRGLRRNSTVPMCRPGAQPG